MKNNWIIILVLVIVIIAGAILNWLFYKNQEQLDELEVRKSPV